MKMFRNAMKAIREHSAPKPKVPAPRHRYKVLINYQGEVYEHYTMAISSKQALMQGVAYLATWLQHATRQKLLNHVLTKGNSHEVIDLGEVKKEDGAAEPTT